MLHQIMLVSDVYRIVDWIALPSLLVMAALAIGARRIPWLEWSALAWALLLSNYLLPGFHNPLVFDHVRFSADAAPFTMYLNVDKTAAGLFLYVFTIPRPPLANAAVIPRAWLAVTGLLMAVSWAFGYAHPDLKWPTGGFLWAINNLLLVCLAEEAIFRGVLQRRLSASLGSGAAIVIAAAAFGLQHYRGGPAYVVLAAVAGLFYGYVYARTRRIEASMLVHFGLNLVHFATFTYPSVDASLVR